jgi:hypothetical protein
MHRERGSEWRRQAEGHQTRADCERRSDRAVDLVEGYCVVVIAAPNDPSLQELLLAYRDLPCLTKPVFLLPLPRGRRGMRTVDWWGTGKPRIGQGGVWRTPPTAAARRAAVIPAVAAALRPVPVVRRLFAPTSATVTSGAGGDVARSPPHPAPQPGPTRQDVIASAGSRHHNVRLARLHGAGADPRPAPHRAPKAPARRHPRMSADHSNEIRTAR